VILITARYKYIIRLTLAELVEAGFDKLSQRKFCDFA